MVSFVYCVLIVLSRVTSGSLSSLFEYLVLDTSLYLISYQGLSPQIANWFFSLRSCQTLLFFCLFVFSV